MGGGGKGRGRGAGKGNREPIKTDKWGAPLNVGPWVNGPLAASKKSGGSKGGSGGGKGSGRGGGDFKGNSRTTNLVPNRRGDGGRGGGAGRGGGGNRSSLAQALIKAQTAKQAAKAQSGRQSKPEDTSVAVGMGRTDEWLVRQALRAARLSGDGLDDDENSEELALDAGDRCLAICDEDGEWYEAVVEDVGDTWIVVYFEEWDLLEELVYDIEHVCPLPEDDDADATTKGQPPRSQRRPRARVPATPASNPHKLQRESLPVFAYRTELLAAIREHQVVVVEGDTGCADSALLPHPSTTARKPAPR